MKITAIIISILVLQTSASFFDEFRGRFENVENSFGKLLTDVVTDVRDTIDCTIMAVQQVFSIDGMFKDTSEYDRKCRGVTELSVQQTDVRDDSYSTRTQDPADEALETTREIAEEVSNELSVEIKASVNNMNETVKDIIDNSEAHKEIETVKSALKDETDRLSKISVLLNRELDNLSTNVKEEIKNTAESSVEEVLNEVRLLYETEKNEKNSSEAKEIRHVFDEVLETLHVNDTTGILSDDDEVKTIMKDLERSSNKTFTDIENQFSQWKNDERKHLEDIESIVSKQGAMALGEEANDDFPKTFKEVAQKIFLESDKNNSELEQPELNAFNSPAQRILQESEANYSEAPKQSQLNPFNDVANIIFQDSADNSAVKVEEPKPLEEIDQIFNPIDTTTEKVIAATETKGSLPDYDDIETSVDEHGGFSHAELELINQFLGVTNGESHRAAVRDAQILIEKSQYSDMIMNDFFNNADKKDSSNVFDNPDLMADYFR